jgi:hypothetical protein
VGPGASTRHLTGDIRVVLDRDRHTQQGRRLPRLAAAIRSLRLVEGLIAHDDSERIDLGVQLLDPGEVKLGQLARGDLAGADQLRLAGDPCEREVWAVHAAILCLVV